MYSEDLDFEIVKILKLELDNRKEAFKLVDFNDMIQKFIDRADDLCPTFDVVFIDEHRTYHLYNGRCMMNLKRNQSILF